MSWANSELLGLWRLYLEGDTATSWSLAGALAI